MKKTIHSLTLGLALVLGALPDAFAQSTAFTYQGRLTNLGSPASGPYDLKFTLCSDAGGTPAPEAVDNPQERLLTLANGLFVVELNFGPGPFTGSPLWLQLDARPHGDSPPPYTTLLPRQPLTAAPYALYAARAGSFTGSVLDSQLPANIARLDGNPVFTGAVGFFPASGPPFTVGSTVKVGNLNADLLDGLDASAFALSGHHHLGQTWSGPSPLGLHLATTASSAGAVALRSRQGSGAGLSLTIPLALWAESSDGHGVFGATSLPLGRGVMGWHLATTGAGRGVDGYSKSTSGSGVNGLADALSGLTYGVYGRSDSTIGRGVQGTATAVSGVNYGVYGESASPNGRGVFGTVTDASGENFGVRGETASTDGTGVFGLANATSGEANGVYGATLSTGGRGVQGTSTAVSGTTYGVRGDASSPAGYGVYGSNPSGVAIKAAGSGIIQSSARSHVFVPGNAFVKNTSSDSTRWDVQVNGSALIYRGATAGFKAVYVPVTLPGVLYGQAVTVESITVYYKCQNGANNFIASTALNKQTDAATVVSLASSTVDRTSNVADSYTLTPGANNVLSSSEGILGLFLTLTFANDTEYIQLGGVKVQLKHDQL